jgi:hypothetical protein
MNKSLGYVLGALALGMVGGCDKQQPAPKATEVAVKPGRG